MADSAAAGGRSSRTAASPAALRAVPPWAWLAVLVVGSALIRLFLARKTPAPWIMVDELIYSELAKSFADTGRLLVRDTPTDVYGLVYPVLISPAWAIFDAVPRAYAAAKGINAVVMSLAAVPAYLLARRVLSPTQSLAAAVLTLAVPSMTYTATLMTENAFYPLFLTTALAMVLWLERPSRARAAFLAVAMAAAFMTRSQAVVLLPALLTAPLLVSGREALRRYRSLYLLVAGGALAVIGVQAARGHSPLSLFGAYEAVGDVGYSAGDVAKWFVYHLAGLDLALGLVPFAALVLLGLTMRRLPERHRIFVAVALSLSFWLVLEVAMFASEHTFRISERNLFYVAPLFLIALLVWIERGLPRPQPAAALTAGAAVALPVVVPYEDLIGVSAVSDTPALMPLLWLTERGLDLGDVELVVLAGCAVAALAFLFVPRRYALVLPALVLVYFAVSHHPVTAEHRYRSAQHLFGGITGEHRDWIDRLVGRGSDVALVWSGKSDKYTVWQNEIFNRSVGDVYTTGPAVPGGLAQSPVVIDRQTGYVRTEDGSVVRAPYVLTDVSVELDGSVVAEDERTRMLLYRVGGPLRQVAFVDGLYPEDTWSKRNVAYVRHGCRGGTLVVDLQSDPSLFTKPNTVVARVGDRVVARTEVFPALSATMRVPLEPVGDSCTVRFQVADTAVPKLVTSGANPDPRPLGMHFNRFRYVP